MKYLMTWMGRTESHGCGMGDTGGYPEMKMLLVTTPKMLADTFMEDATYYSLKKVDLAEAAKVLKSVISNGGDDD
jgi:hypothetical protein